MLRYMLRRLMAMPLLLLGIITLAFLLSHFIHGDPLASVLTDRAMENPEAVAAARERWGLDKSLLEQYFIYVSNLVQGDFGTSFRTKRSVAVDLVDRLPATFELVIAAMLIGSVIGISLGVIAAKWHNGAVDHTARLFALIGSSMPAFWSGLIFLYAFTVALDWLPGVGRIDARLIPPPVRSGLMTVDALLEGDLALFRNALAHLILPATVLGWAEMGLISRMVRANMLDVLNQDFVLLARAKGAGEGRVLIRHALRNALIPTLTIIAFSLAYLITGAVLTETIFSWPGIGTYAVDSARSLDHPAIIGVSIIGGVSVLLINFVTDLVYVIVEPRIRFSRDR
jgi:ABC-type dipeptide/oligopeptide/nickel transport system permease component